MLLGEGKEDGHVGYYFWDIVMIVMMVDRC